MAASTRTIFGLNQLAWRAFLVSLATTALTAVAGTIFDQTRGLLSVVAAAVLILGYFISGAAVEAIALRMADGNGMGLTLISYAVRVAVLGGILWWAMSTPAVSALFANSWVAAGALASLFGWLTGLLIAHSRARVAIYDRPYEAPQGWDQ